MARKPEGALSFVLTFISPSIICPNYQSQQLFALLLYFVIPTFNIFSTQYEYVLVFKNLQIFFDSLQYYCFAER